jgi:hypothetical protein
MQKLTLAALAAMAVALSLAVVPALTTNAMAAKGGINPGGGTEEECVHNGNGRVTEGECENGNSGNTVTTTCQKIRGKFVCTSTTTD